MLDQHRQHHRCLMKLPHLLHQPHHRHHRQFQGMHYHQHSPVLKCLNQLPLPPSLDRHLNRLNLPHHFVDEFQNHRQRMLLMNQTGSLFRLHHLKHLNRQPRPNQQ